jgi:putative aldouronate transport system substrate-binding protein
MNGLTDDDWDAYISQLDAYGLSQYLEIYQNYLDSYYAN